MRLSHLKRPLVLALLLYCAWLCRLKGLGRLGILPADDASRLAPREPARVVGRVASPPVERRGHGEFLLELESVDGEPASGKAFVKLASAPPLDLGERVAIGGRLSLPPPDLIEGAPSWRGYLVSIGVRSVLRGDSVEGLKAAPALLRAVSAFRRSMTAAFDRALSPGNSAVLRGLVLGDKTSIAREELDAFRDAGAMALLVASGQNVSFLPLLAGWLVRRLGGSRGLAVAAGLGLGGFYTLAAGAGAPLVRAYAMMAAAALGWLLDRDSGAFQGLTLAAWALLLVEPSMLFQAGFLMSCAATFAILLAVAFCRAPAGWPLWARRAAEAAWVGGAAQLTMTPLTAAYFHRVSLVGFLCNPVLVPAAMALLAAGFALYAASLLPWCGPAWVLGRATGAGTSLFRTAVAFCGGLPWAAVWSPAPPPWRTAEFQVSAAPQASTALVLSPEKLLLVNAGLPGEDLAHAVLALGRRRLDEVRLTGLSRRNWKGLGILSGIVRIGRVVAPAGPEPEELAQVRRALTARGVEWSADLSARPDRPYEARWRGLAVAVGPEGVRFHGEWEQFDIIGPFEVRPRRAVTLRFDGAAAWMKRST